LAAAFLRLMCAARRWRLMALLYCLPIMLCFYLNCIDNAVIMKTWLRSFNIYLLAAAVVFAGGCSSHSLSPKKDYATLSIF